MKTVRLLFDFYCNTVGAQNIAKRERHFLEVNVIRYREIFCSNTNEFIHVNVAIFIKILLSFIHECQELEYRVYFASRQLVTRDICLTKFDRK